VSIRRSHPAPARRGSGLSQVTVDRLPLSLRGLERPRHRGMIAFTTPASQADRVCARPVAAGITSLLHVAHTIGERVS
jgi:hypothetical protein